MYPENRKLVEEINMIFNRDISDLEKAFSLEQLCDICHFICEDAIDDNMDKHDLIVRIRLRLTTLKMLK